MLSAKLVPIIRRVITNPQILKMKCPEMEKSLQSQGNMVNNNNSHEALFENLLKENGFNPIAIKKKNDYLKCLPAEGYYYIHQPNGSQAPPDFVILYINDNIVKESYKIDCKYSKSESIMLNDGWFHSDTLYVMTWTANKNVKGLIAFGDIFTTEQDYNEWQAFRLHSAEMNSRPREGRNYSGYSRNAGQYSLKHDFTDTNIQTYMNETINRLQPRKKFIFKKPTTPVAVLEPPQSPAEPHSPLEQSALS